MINHAGKGSLVVAADPVGWLVDMNMRLHKKKKKNGDEGERDPLQNEHQREGKDDVDAGSERARHSINRHSAPIHKERRK